MPRASMIRAMPESPAPPMPTKWTVPSWSAGSSVSGTGTLIGGPPAAGRRAEDHVGELLVGVERDQVRRRGRHRASRSGSVSRSGTVARDPLGGQRRVGDQQPAAGVDDRAGVERLLAVADRQGHVDRGQPDAGDLGDGVAAGAAQHGVGGGVGEVHPVDVGHRDVRRPAGRRPAGVASPFGPTTCSTWTPAAAKLGAAAATDSLSRRAPWEPPVTSRVGRSGSSPKVSRASARAAPRGRGC